MTLYITGVYIFIGFMDSVMAEIKFSAKLYLFNTTRNDDETFFDNYNTINQEPPEFELYFLTSNLSDKILDLIGVYWQTFIIIGINAAIFFGIYHFDFHILQENINTRYSIWQFLYSCLMYILLYLSIGVISTLPYNIFTSAFDQYEKWNEKRMKKNNNNENQNIPNQENNKNEVNPEGEEGEHTKEYNGYFLGFLISILVSMGLKFILNRFVISQKHGKIEKFYGLLIVCHFSPIILSLIVYCIFSIIFNKKIVKPKNKKKSTKSCRVCGYVYYSEEEPNDVEIKCEGCRKGFRKCYYNCLCNTCSCFKCCECKKCCCCYGEEQDLSEVNHREKKICIIYYTTGKWSWFCDLFTSHIMLYNVLIMFILEFCNFGFKPDLSEYLGNIDDSQLYKFNLLNLAGILLFYFITLLSGLCYKKCLHFNEDKGEGTNLGFGIGTLFFTGSLVSFIASIITYFSDISEKAKHYIMPFSIGSIEFYKIILKNIADGIFKTSAISFDSIFSIYVIIWNIFAFILDILKAKSKKLILAQFIISLFLIIIGIIYFICILALPKLIVGFKNETNEKLKNENENKTNENQINTHNNIEVYVQKEENSNENRNINQMNNNKK